LKITVDKEQAVSKGKLALGTILGLILITASLFLRINSISSKGSDADHTYKLSDLATPASSEPIETIGSPSVNPVNP